jgi:hypothetical protein
MRFSSRPSRKDWRCCCHRQMRTEIDGLLVLIAVKRVNGLSHIHQRTHYQETLLESAQLDYRPVLLYYVAPPLPLLPCPLVTPEDHYLGWNHSKSSNEGETPFVSRVHTKGRVKEGTDEWLQACSTCLGEGAIPGRSLTSGLSLLHP